MGKTDTCLTASFQGQHVSRHHQKVGKTILDFNEARDDGVAVSSAGPYANHLYLTIKETTLTVIGATLACNQ